MGGDGVLLFMFAAVSTHEQRQSLRRGKECSYNYFGTLQKRNKSWGKEFVAVAPTQGWPLPSGPELIL